MSDEAGCAREEQALVEATELAGPSPINEKFAHGRVENKGECARLLLVRECHRICRVRCDLRAARPLRSGATLQRRVLA